MKKNKEKISRLQGIKLMAIALVLTIILSVFTRIIYTAEINSEFSKFLIAISLSMAGIGTIAFQLDKNIKKDLLNFSIIMIFSGLLGILYLLNLDFQIIGGLNWGNISSFLFIWGIIHLLAILFEEKILLN
jgi:hypothetical protein